MSTRSKTRLFLFVMLMVALIAGLIDWPAVSPSWPGAALLNKLQYKLGLDLQGGAHLVYEADTSAIDFQDRESTIEGVRNVIERRVNVFGVSEPVVQTNKAGENYRVIVELAGVFDVNEAIRSIGKTPLLEFKEQSLALAEPPATNEEGQGDDNRPAPDPWLNTKLSGKHLKRASVQFQQTTGEPEVSLEFNEEGADLFAEITGRNIGKPVAIFLDGAPLSIPTVQSKITAGRAVITGNFTVAEAKDLAQNLNAGALPVPITLASQQTIGPSLGTVSLQKSLQAGIWGLVLVAFFMIILYRLPGLLSVLALGVYAIATLFLFQVFGVTLTLAGIAGFILSVGMAVDANVLIFERTKEELRSGKAVVTAVEEGFKRAWTSIRDSNFSSLITCAILFWFGTSIIKGFAVTLAVGIMVSMFSAITLTRGLMRVVVGQWAERAKWAFGNRIKN